MDIYTIRKALAAGKSIYDLPLRVTYYARVSTGKDEQKNSLENQDMYYKNKILSVSKWILVPGYTDNGITGTSTRKRKDFNDMIEDGMNDKYDFILTKEVCRFARNTLDTLQITRDLLSKGKGVFFEIDNINTFEMEGELRLTIMASLAQDESRRLSERTKFGFKRSIEKGRVLGSNCIYGYVKDNCKLKIDENEVNIIKRVFEVYSKGNVGIRKLGRELAKEGIVARSGKPLSYSTVKGIIENPKYKGFYRGNRTEVIDFLTKKQIIIPQEEWVLYKTTDDIVPQIVTEDLWNKCNEIKEKRNKKFTGLGSTWNNQYQYSKLLICTNDGKTYWRKKNRPSATKEFWSCSEYLKNSKGKCNNNTTLATDELNVILEDVFKEMILNKNKIIKNMLIKNREILDHYNNDNFDTSLIQNEVNELEQSKKNLIKLYSLNKISEEEFEELNEEYKRKIKDYKSQITDAEDKKEKREILKNEQKIKDYFDFEDVKITKEFIHEKIHRIYVTQIKRNHVKLKINFHFDLGVSEVDKKSICLGLTMCKLGAVALSFTPKRDPCLTISGSSKIKSSIEGVTIPYPFLSTSSKASAILSYLVLDFESSLIIVNSCASLSIFTPVISVKTL